MQGKRKADCSKLRYTSPRVVHLHTNHRSFFDLPVPQKLLLHSPVIVKRTPIL